MRVLSWLSAAVALVAVFSAVASFLFESSYRSRASMLQVATIGSDGELQKQGKPFLGFAPEGALLPGFGDANSRLVRQGAKDDVIPVDPLLTMLSLGRLASFALFVTSTLVFFLSRRAARGGIFNSTVPDPH